MNIPENFDRWMFDYLEGNLSQNEKDDFENFLQENPNYEIDAEVWKETFVADDNVIYMHQDSLIKKRRILAWLNWRSAAAILLLFGTSSVLFFANRQFQNTDAIANHPISTNDGELISTVSNNKTTQESYTNNRLGINEEDANELNNQNQLSLLAVQTNANSNSLNSRHNLKSRFGNGNNSNNNRANTNSANTQTTRTFDYPTEKFGMASATPVFSDDTKNEARKTKSDAIKQAEAKLNGDKYSSAYQNNPKDDGLNLDMKQKKEFKSQGTALTALKKVKNKIERALSYPVGLVNLRDPELLMPENSLMAFNPGFTGAMLKSRFEARYRNQWYGTDQNSHSASYSFDTYASSIKGGIGMMVNANFLSNGGFGDYNVALFYSPKFSISKDIVFEPAIKVVMGQIAQKTSLVGANKEFELIRGEVLNSGSEATTNTIRSAWYKDYGLGFVLNTTWFYLGANVDNIGGHYANVYATEDGDPKQASLVSSVIIGGDWENDKKTVTFSPFVAYKKTGEKSEAWTGLNYRYNNFLIGGSVSSDKDFVGSIGMKFRAFKLMYHIDQTQSIVENDKFLSHNLTIRFNGKLKNTRFKY